MDRRDAMMLSGSAPYYMQREMAGQSPGQGTLTNPSSQFQTNFGSSSIPSTLHVDSSFTNQLHGVNVGAPADPVVLAEPLRRKRGRPRKYGPEGAVSLGLSPSISTPSRKLTSSQRRGRGRPPGSGRKQQLASLGEWLSGSAGLGFTPHVITIPVGEDITTKIMSLAQQGPRAICILSANGVISTVTLLHPTTGGTVTYEGRFEILCLSGSYLNTNRGGGHRSQTGGLSVSLTSPDGRVIGGGVGGVLIAASPVQVIVGSFLCGNLKMKSTITDAGNSDCQTVENPVTQKSFHQSWKFNYDI